MKLSGDQVASIHGAILDGYHDRQELAAMVRMRLEENLDAIAGGATLSTLVMSLIDWGERTHNVRRLVDAAQAHNPTNPSLQALQAQVQSWQIDVAPAPPSASGQALAPPRAGANSEPSRRRWLAGGLVLAGVLVLGVLLAAQLSGLSWSNAGYQQGNGSVVISTETPSLNDIDPTALPIVTPAVGLLTTLSAPLTVTVEPAATTVDILIAEFDSRHAGQQVEIGRRLEQDLEQQLRDYDLKDVVVKVLDEPVGDDDQANVLAQSNGSRAVIWGWYDDIGMSVRILLTDPNVQGQDVPGIRDLPLTLGGDAAAELAFVIREVLLDNVSFLSLFVIGHLYASNNEYANARTAFDAAMNNLPENVAFENEAILHFFRARQMEAAGSQDYDTIICEYASSIELDPGLAEAYNNLGVRLVRMGYKLDYPGASPGVAYSCLERAGINPDSPDNLFEKALAVQPGWAVPQYNRLVQQWSRNPGRMDSGEVSAQLESLLAKDPTLGGAHVFLGLIEAGAENYAAAREHLVAALERVPLAHMGRVHAALGQVYLRLGDYANAENEYQKALALDVGDQEARLGLAVAVYSLGGSARAVDLAQDIVTDAPNGAHQMGVVLQSRVAFDDGQFLQAAQLLQGLLQDSDGSAKVGNPAFLRYLAGLLSLAGGDAAAAEAHLSAPELLSKLEATVPISMTQIPVLSPPRVLDDAWSALAERCATKWQWEEESARLEVLVDDPCLPAELGQRIAAVYDIWQDQLGKRFYDTGTLLEVLPIFALPP